MNGVMAVSSVKQYNSSIYKSKKTYISLHLFSFNYMFSGVYPYI
jgi:hypothetical protein